MMANAVRWAMLCLLLQGPFAMSQDAASEPTPATTRNVLDDIEWLVNSLLPSVMPALSELVGSPNVSTACTTSLFKSFLALKRREPWALRSEYLTLMRTRKSRNVSLLHHLLFLSL